MIRVSIQTRQALSRLVLPATFVMAFAVLMLGKADTVVAERARVALADALAPAYAVLAEPIGSVAAAVREARHLWNLRSENARLREENERLRRWHAAALALEADNARLKAQLAWVPEIPGQFTTARVVADQGGLYARAALVALAPRHSVAKGQIALDERGVVGRVTEVGSRSARIVLLTDLNARVPVTLERSGARALLVGTNTARPRLQHWPEGVTPQEGERVVTSAEANAYPAGLPVGTVHFSASGVPEVHLAARLDRLEMVRLFDYGLRGVLPPEDTARIESPRAPRR